MSPEEAILEASKMSDHAPQINHAAKIVSQNIQGPYAIKPGNLNWVFDLPEHRPYYALELSKMTGMSPGKCIHLIKAMKIKNIHQFFRKDDEKGVGDYIGNSPHRRSIESHVSYQERIEKQIAYLIQSIEGNAEILCLQEQPFNSAHDEHRKHILQSIMDQFGYLEIASLSHRDVGIWVLKSKAFEYRPPADEELISFVTKAPIRGCVAQNDSHLIINVHMNRVEDKLQQISILKELCLKAYSYALSQSPALQVSIHGDFNLYQYRYEHMYSLTNIGFQLEFGKGQEQFLNPNLEASVQALDPDVARAILFKLGAKASPQKPRSIAFFKEESRSRTESSKTLDITSSMLCSA